jgi:hypothetical protein
MAKKPDWDKDKENLLEITKGLKGDEGDAMMRAVAKGDFETAAEQAAKASELGLDQINHF